jgi:phosphonate transport system permease protein
MTARDRIVRDLRRGRPRSRFVRASVVFLLALAASSWWLGGFDLVDMFSGRHARNLEHFVHEATPRPVREEGGGFAEAAAWAGDLFRAKGAEALGTTLAISVLAIVLAGIAANLLCLPAARTFARPAPFLPPGGTPPWFARAAWRALLLGTRFVLVFLRAIPEYVWAFLLLAVFGPTAWPAVLALAIHNAGILGKLQAETIENVPPQAARALTALGAGRRQVALLAVHPTVFPRFLLYFFYRWETAVREATVLGMLGIVSLGYVLMYDARPRGREDEMVFYVALGALLVLAGDLVSAAARRLVRHAR